MLVLDAWRRSALPGSEFSKIVQVSPHTLNAWRRRFDEMGPEGLSDHPRGVPKGSRLPEATRRAILLMKETHPDWGSERIHAMLLRGEGFAASAGAILRVLEEEGYEAVEFETRPHPAEPRGSARTAGGERGAGDLDESLLPARRARAAGPGIGARAATAG